MSGSVYKFENISLFQECISSRKEHKQNERFLPCGVSYLCLQSGRIGFMARLLSFFHHHKLRNNSRVNADWSIRSLPPCSQNFFELMRSEIGPTQRSAVQSSWVCWVQTRKWFGLGPKSNFTEQFRITISFVKLLDVKIVSPAELQNIHGKNTYCQGHINFLFRRKFGN
jgi:hypothetical protein